MIDGFTDGIASVGRGKLRLRLDLMLHEMATSKVAGEYQFASNAVTVDPRLPPIQRASGQVSFTESSLAIHDVRGQLFGDQVRISGGSGPETGVTVVAEGRATIEGMRPLFDHPWRRRLSGASRYTATVTVKDGRVQLNFDSPLEGVASTLPAPLSKTAGETLPLRIEVLPGEGRDRISIALGPQAGRIATAEFLRAGQGRGMPPFGPLQVQRSLITLNPVAGETQRIPERRGMTVRGALPALDLERWLPLFAVEWHQRGGHQLRSRRSVSSMRSASACGRWPQGATDHRLVGDHERGGITAATLSTVPRAAAGWWRASRALPCPRTRRA
jgi:uncharacterized protein YhdP